jgi:hypothetical protein
MDQPIVVVPVTVVVVLVVELLLLLVLGGGSLARFGPAWQAFRRALADAAFADKVNALLNPSPPEPPKPPKRSAEPLRLLTLLQREGRLLDFLLEDVSAATDDQLGAGVRDIHRDAQAAIKKHLVLEPVLSRAEGETVEVPPGFDPSAIRLTGNVTGQPPFRGTLRHQGWRAKDYNLPAAPEGWDEFVVAPAEVELP